MKKKSKAPAPIINRRARFDYFLSDELITGLTLSGKQVRAARDNAVSLQGSYINITKNHELYLTNALFTLKNNDPNRKEATVADNSPVKLLATKKQIAALLKEKQNGLTIIPTKLLTQGRHIKLVIALGKGKKHYDKRETIKKRDLSREVQN
jgi:SsrA-binding protein